MADNKKYIGEGKLPQEPNKKLTLKLKDGSVTTSKVANGAIDYSKLGINVRSLLSGMQATLNSQVVKSVTINGGASKYKPNPTDGNVNLVISQDGATDDETLANQVIENSLEIRDIKERVGDLEDGFWQRVKIIKYWQSTTPVCNSNNLVWYNPDEKILYFSTWAGGNNFYWQDPHYSDQDRFFNDEAVLYINIENNKLYRYSLTVDDLVPVSDIPQDIIDSIDNSTDKTVTDLEITFQDEVLYLRAKYYDDSTTEELEFPCATEEHNGLMSTEDKVALENVWNITGKIIVVDFWGTPTPASSAMTEDREYWWFDTSTKNLFHIYGSNSTPLTTGKYIIKRSDMDALYLYDAATHSYAELLSSGVNYIVPILWSDLELEMPYHDGDYWYKTTDNKLYQYQDGYWNPVPNNSLYILEHTGALYFHINTETNQEPCRKIALNIVTDINSQVTKSSDKLNVQITADGGSTIFTLPKATSVAAGVMTSEDKSTLNLFASNGLVTLDKGALKNVDFWDVTPSGYYVPYVTLWKRGNELLYYAGPGNWQLYEEAALTEHDGKVYLYKPNEGFIIINPDQLPPAEDDSIKLLIAIQDAAPTPPHATGILYYNTTEQKLYSSYRESQSIYAWEEVQLSTTTLFIDIVNNKLYRFNGETLIQIPEQDTTIHIEQEGAITTPIAWMNSYPTFGETIPTGYWFDSGTNTLFYIDGDAYDPTPIENNDDSVAGEGTDDGEGEGFVEDEEAANSISSEFITPITSGVFLLANPNDGKLYILEITDGNSELISFAPERVLTEGSKSAVQGGTLFTKFKEVSDFLPEDLGIIPNTSTQDIDIEIVLRGGSSIVGDIPHATATLPGVMSAVDKSRLDNLFLGSPKLKVINPNNPPVSPEEGTCMILPGVVPTIVFYYNGLWYYADGRVAVNPNE